ncbi:uncharacterized protein C3orf85 [Oryzias melastigma]|uniref:Uncharacterized protein n=1 Tax=Oryzias melastigma TaxID=30732 RepID=A0A3B3CKU1_ORYME|nr:uncharacterized protein C3orf85 [Oryzias melastigma]XP_036069834.1 uncharacterized protein C3orf85 [Oryzias melastigma]
MKVIFLMAILGGVFAAPVMKEQESKQFIRLKRQAGYWDPHHSQNQWGFTIQEQANEYWTSLRTQAQYYMDMGNMVFDPSVADENRRQYMEMLRHAQAHLDMMTRRQS